MVKQTCVLALAFVLVVVGFALAQQPAQPPPQQAAPASQYPLMEKIAAKIIQKYQTSSCVQLATEKSQPATGEQAVMEQRAIEMLKKDAEMRKAFLAMVAAPIADKLLQCGMIP